MRAQLKHADSAVKKKNMKASLEKERSSLLQEISSAEQEFQTNQQSRLDAEEKNLQELHENQRASLSEELNTKQQELVQKHKAAIENIKTAQIILSSISNTGRNMKSNETLYFKPSATKGLQHYRNSKKNKLRC